MYYSKKNLQGNIDWEIIMLSKSTNYSGFQGHLFNNPRFLSNFLFLFSS